MSEQQVLQYADFIWRVSQVATEHQAWDENSMVSLPVVASHSSQLETDDRSLLAFLYSSRPGTESINPQIFPPYARIQVRPDGALVEWEPLPQSPGQAPVGARFAGEAASMTATERTCFLETYYAVLTAPEGPLWRPEVEITNSVRQDLRELFHALVELSLLPSYEQYASGFLSLIAPHT